MAAGRSTGAFRAVVILFAVAGAALYTLYLLAQHL